MGKLFLLYRSLVVVFAAAVVSFVVYELLQLTCVLCLYYRGSCGVVTWVVSCRCIFFFSLLSLAAGVGEQPPRLSRRVSYLTSIFDGGGLNHCPASSNLAHGGGKSGNFSWI